MARAFTFVAIAMAVVLAPHLAAAGEGAWLFSPAGKNSSRSSSLEVSQGAGGRAASAPVVGHATRFFFSKAPPASKA